MATNDQPRLGWIGLGSMGLGMATNLQKHVSQLPGAFPLQYHNRTMSRGDPLRELGASPAESIPALTASSDVIFLSLSNDEALSAAIDAVLGAEGSLEGKLVVDTSTVHPDSSVAARDRLAARGVVFLATPVFGASPVAAEGKLLWILAGPEAGVQVITPYLVGVMARQVIRLGEDVKQASLLKTAGNFITAGMMEVIAEAHVFAEKSGLGDAAMSSLIEQQYGPLALSMSRRLTTGAYMPAPGQRPWSDLQLALKDVSHGVKVAEASGARLHVAEVALGHLTEASREGRPLDSSSMYGVLRRQAGLDFATDLVKERDGLEK